MADFKISPEQERWIEGELDDTAGHVVKTTTLKWLIEKFVNEERARQSKPSEKSYIIKCLIKGREGDDVALFEKIPEGFVVKLDGYAIIPMEEYGKLQKDGALSGI